MIIYQNVFPLDTVETQKNSFGFFVYDKSVVAAFMLCSFSSSKKMQI